MRLFKIGVVVCDRCLGMLGERSFKIRGCVRSLFRNKLGER
ncbi:hypothetical protein [Dolichospermum sp. LEGE 00240]|nr:hypothetical protein [Dolichospermum sp. LEGE 00240]